MKIKISIFFFFFKPKQQVSRLLAGNAIVLLMDSFHIHLFLKDPCLLPFQILVLGGMATVSKHFSLFEGNSLPCKKSIGCPLE